jgi:sigma-E factor negative regulatory protein RseA
MTGEIMKQSDIKRDEQLSALLDNALDAQQLQAFMQDLKRDPVADAETAQRYRLMGDAMRDEIDQSSFMDISAAVSRAIERETAHGAEEAPARTPFNLGALLNAWFKPLAGLSVAASVAVVTLLTFNSINQSPDVVSPAQQQMALSTVNSDAPATQLQRVNPEIARNVRVASTVDPAQKSPQQQKQLNIYMLQHSSYASQSTLQGMMPYVRAADVKSREAE